NVKGRREDGYHLIDAEMVSIDLCDELLISDGSGIKVRSAGSGFDVPIDHSNLVNQALEMTGRTADVTIIKRIPAGAGLGGGSTNAAAVLRWAGFDDPIAAAKLGADVAFCLKGGRAHVRGIGEILEPLPYRQLGMTLLIPPIGVSTPEVYRAWDELNSPTGDHGNDLETAALTVEPRLAEWRDVLTEATGKQARMAGSGGTWFVEGHHEAFTHRGTTSKNVVTVPAQDAKGDAG
ncbi:MAG: 4-(cytidine 5'-diphospho)-2-C-methyl-D-erythritol kinase, partial [Acidimicrobiales bacterium]|nr:4-(cytidine 5'-diphospho)-2-C-methyl-D-erythritol kinase [Acidimicrobiales bacterium]